MTLMRIQLGRADMQDDTTLECMIYSRYIEILNQYEKLCLWIINIAAILP